MEMAGYLVTCGLTQRPPSELTVSGLLFTVWLWRGEGDSGVLVQVFRWQNEHCGMYYLYVDLLPNSETRTI